MDTPVSRRPWPNVWPDSIWPEEHDLEELSEAGRLMKEASRGLDEALRAEEEPSVWEYIGSVFDEFRNRGGKRL